METLVFESDNPPPVVFLSHATEDKSLVRAIARTLTYNGIEVFFDEWSIAAGESIRQRIDEGLGACTHFLVLLTSNSLTKPWVKTEIDAGFAKRLEGKCRFLPIRVDVSVGDLPPTLHTLYAPELDLTDLMSLVDIIHGVPIAPSLGPPPSTVSAYEPDIGRSPAAQAIIRHFIESSEHGLGGEPLVEMGELRTATGLSSDALIDAVDELEQLGYATVRAGISGDGPVRPTSSLFVDFDHFYTSHDAATDALAIAVRLLDVESANTQKLADEWSWPTRRMNPALAFLVDEGLVLASESNAYPWETPWILATHDTRRFVQANAQ